LRRRRRLLLAAFLGGARRHSQRRCAVRSLDDRSYSSNKNAVSRRPSAVRSVNTSLGLEYRLDSDINPGINMNMRISNHLGMVCSSYYGWDHIAMLCTMVEIILPCYVLGWDHIAMLCTMVEIILPCYVLWLRSYCHAMWKLDTSTHIGFES
jgi:hypothetical protein